jgi:hypothetical protein
LVLEMTAKDHNIREWDPKSPKSPGLTGIAIGGNATQALGTTTGTLTLTAAAIPAGAVVGPITWTSSDPTKATVNASTGLVTGVATGSVTITATGNGFTDTVTITIP